MKSVAWKIQFLVHTFLTFSVDFGVVAEADAAEAADDECALFIGLLLESLAAVVVASEVAVAAVVVAIGILPGEAFDKYDEKTLNLRVH